MTNINGPKNLWTPQRRKPAVTRRGFLGVTGASTAGLLLIGCSADSEGGSDLSAQATDLMEAPQLTEQVDAGELPPLEERLPANPLAVDYVEGPGQYGGTWHFNS